MRYGKDGFAGDWALGCLIQLGLLLFTASFLTTDNIASVLAYALILALPALAVRFICHEFDVEGGWFERLLGPGFLVCAVLPMFFSFKNKTFNALLHQIPFAHTLIFRGRRSSVLETGYPSHKNLSTHTTEVPLQSIPLKRFVVTLVSASGSYGVFVNSLADGYFQAHSLNILFLAGVVRLELTTHGLGPATGIEPVFEPAMPPVLDH